MKAILGGTQFAGAVPSLTRNLSLASMLLLLLGLASCGGGGGDSPAPSAPNNLVATAVLNTAPVASCPNGGITVEGGIDSNGNKVLDPTEVTSTQYVCNGAAGTTGANGLSTLVLVTSEPAGANCATGGKKVSAGKDTNANNILEAGEITTTAYVCNGVAGGNGTNGNNGLNSLVAIVPEPAGAFCTYAGSKVSNGVDSNANGILDSTEVTSSHYVCNGAPGATGPAGPGLTWVNVTGTSAQAAANTGYLANNDAAQVTITLPISPVLGDIVQVSGIGSGGWKVAQNAGQSIITKDLVGNISVASIGAAWTARDAVRNWNGVSSSADGSKLVAAVGGGQLYTSTDFGVTWTARDAVRGWYGVASSADGSKLVATVFGGQLYTSTDFGVTWTARDAVRGWYGVASSADGSKLVAAVGGGQLYTSTDFGVTWTARDAVRSWSGVASSADGSKLLASVTGGQLYTSTDFGVTWTARDAVRTWYGVASSADGSKLIAATFAGQLYTSTDFGVTWLPRDTVRGWFGVASSADGSRLVAGTWGGGPLYTTTDFGVTWTARDAARSWSGVASSADGSRLIAAAIGGQLYTSGPSSVASTTLGVTGSLSGAQYDAVDLQCVGNNTFMVRGYAGYLNVQ